MKAVFYVGATLMIGASIYGFVDYQKTSQAKEFKTMYDPKIEKETAVEQKPVQEPVNPIKEIKVSESKRVSKKQATEPVLSVTKEEAKLPEMIIPDKNKMEAGTPVVKETTPEIKIEKKFSYRLFSRAAPGRSFTKKEKN